MSDHHRVHRILRCQFCIEEAILSVSIGLLGLDAKDVTTRVYRSQPSERSLQSCGKCIVGLPHAREHGVATAYGEFAREQYRSKSGDLIVAVIGVPAAADVSGLRWLLPHLCNLWIARHGLEKPIDVDPPHPFCKGDMLLRRQALVAEKNYAISVEGLTDVGDHSIVEFICQINA